MSILATTEEEKIERMWNSLDFGEIELFLKEHLRQQITFEELVEMVAKEGFSALNADSICTFAFDTLFYEISVFRPILLKLLFVSVLFSLFHKLLVSKSKYISDVGFLTVYSFLMVLLMQSFMLVSDVAKEGMDTLIMFLNVLIPTYAVSMTFSGNGISGAVLYESAFALLYGIQWFMKLILCPLVKGFILILFLNHLFEEDKISKLADFIEKGITIALKTAFGAVIGLGVVQAMILPVRDRIATNTILSGLSSIPGIGNIAGSAGDVLLSCGILIKNSVGVAGLLCLVFLAVVPVLKIGCFVVMYHFLTVILQPLADKRMISCISAVARGCALYLKMVVETMILFFILFSIVSGTTSFIY